MPRPSILAPAALRTAPREVAHDSDASMRLLEAAISALALAAAILLGLAH